VDDNALSAACGHVESAAAAQERHEAAKKALQQHLALAPLEIEVSRRIYQRGFRDLEFCVISALGYAQIWGKGQVYLGLRVYPGFLRSPRLVLFWIRRTEMPRRH